jgi:hypothetical protein
MKPWVQTPVHKKAKQNKQKTNSACVVPLSSGIWNCKRKNWDLPDCYFLIENWISLSGYLSHRVSLKFKKKKTIPRHILVCFSISRTKKKFYKCPNTFSLNIEAQCPCAISQCQFAGVNKYMIEELQNLVEKKLDDYLVYSSNQ